MALGGGGLHLSGNLTGATKTRRTFPRYRRDREVSLKKGISILRGYGTEKRDGGKGGRRDVSQRRKEKAAKTVLLLVSLKKKSMACYIATLRDHSTLGILRKRKRLYLGEESA